MHYSLPYKMAELLSCGCHLISFTKHSDLRRVSMGSVNDTWPVLSLLTILMSQARSRDSLSQTMGSNGLFGVETLARSSFRRTIFADAADLQDTLKVRGRAFDATVLLRPRASLKHLIQANARHKSALPPLTADDPAEQIMHLLGWTKKGEKKVSRIG